MKLKNVTLPRLFQEIEKQSTYRFSYRDADLVGKDPVTVSVKERSLKSILTDILSKRNLQYQVSGNKILITVSSVQTPKSTEKKEVSGIVVDERGEPVIGVNISEKGTTNGTITDMNGRFSFKVGDNSSLLVSYIGYDGQEISVRGKNRFNITLKENLQTLDEVVVIGYGTQSRELLTTSVSKVDNKVLENVPYGNLASALQGAVSGVRVQSTSGQPGEAPRIVVRGGTSIQNPDGAAPLYVVDGITRDEINHLSSNDIESIQVLKDAASTSIYGAKGSNGVVIVTTKSAKAGKASVSYSYDFTISTIGKKYKMANAKDYLTLHRTGMVMQDKFPDATSELGLAKGYGIGNNLTNQTAFTTQYLNDSNRHKLNEGWISMPDPIDPSQMLIFQDNKMSDLAYRTGFSHNHHAEVSGSSERAKFLAGIGYLKNEGTLRATDYNRFSFNINGEVQVLDNLNVTGRVYYSNTRTHTSPFNSAVSFYRNASLAPTAKIYFEDGSYAPGSQWGMSNPLYSMSIAKYTDKSENYTFSLGADWTILPGLSFRPQIALYKTNTEKNRFMPAYWNGPNQQVKTREASASNDQWSHYQVDAVLDYTKTFWEDHHFSAMLGLNYTERIIDSIMAAGRGGATDNITTVNGIAERTVASSSSSTHKMMGYFGRVNYNYKNKYLLSFSARYDGASNLGRNNRYGFFPGISGGWHIDQETFYPDGLKKIVKAKLRASYGVNGNINGLADWAADGNYSVGQTFFGNPAIRISYPANDDVKWERSKTFDIGGDFKFLNGRLNITADYFRRKTDHLITMFTLPPSTGLGDVYTNLGSLENKGVELEINTEILRFGKDGSWTIGFNASRVKNKILELPENGVENNRIGGEYVWDVSKKQYTWQGGLQEGGTMGDMFGYKQLGVYSTDEQAAKAPEDMLITIEDRTKFGGDVNWLDADGDGKIDSKDRVYMGNQYPKWTGGISSNLSFSGFDFYVRADYTAGHTIYNWAKMFLDYSLFGDNNMTQDVVKYSWKKQGDVTDYPRFYRGNFTQCNATGARPGSMYYEKGNFLCFREVTLSYSFLPEIFKKARISNVRVSVTGSNLLYLTSYKGLNPEDGGTDDGRYAMPRNVTFSANLTF
ncbi:MULTISPECIES: TonB-dependent receptor [Parabacteroides]|uniref:TonB-dependent receptor n=1 Tax=Parabacteroides TaxID=375288 RepID=UPI001F274BE8|nr:MULTISPECIES: TonB-dependent receptor [Parabacteroides]